MFPKINKRKKKFLHAPWRRTGERR